MELKIKIGGMFSTHYLTVKSDGIEFSQGNVTKGVRHFRFSQVHCILLSAENRLSFQAGSEVFSIPTEPGNKQHQAVIGTLVDLVAQAPDRDT